MGAQPSVLVTNDDGIGSRFLRELVVALSERFEVFVCAPDEERSWIGHAIMKLKKEMPFK